MKEEDIKICEDIIKVVTSPAIPANCVLFLHPDKAETLKEYLRKIEEGLKEKGNGGNNKNP